MFTYINVLDAKMCSRSETFDNNATPDCRVLAIVLSVIDLVPAIKLL